MSERHPRQCKYCGAAHFGQCAAEVLDLAEKPKQLTALDLRVLAHDLERDVRDTDELYMAWNHYVKEAIPSLRAAVMELAMLYLSEAEGPEQPSEIRPGQIEWARSLLEQQEETTK